MNYLLIENNIPPLVLPLELKGDYIYSLANQDVNKLFEISKLLIKKEKEKIYCFSNKL